MTVHIQSVMTLKTILKMKATNSLSHLCPNRSSCHWSPLCATHHTPPLCVCVCVNERVGSAQLGLVFCGCVFSGADRSKNVTLGNHLSSAVLKIDLPEVPQMSLITISVLCTVILWCYMKCMIHYLL